MPYSDEHKRLLIAVAWESIDHGFEHGRHFDPPARSYPSELLEKRAVFVTLQKGGALRGCIGTLVASEFLIAAVAFYAFQAAFRDPRFSPLARDEAGETSLALSVLSPPEPIVFSDEADLLRQVRPGVDGLIIEDRGRSGTFLPSVWEDLPDKRDFLNHLKRKAGFPESHWSDTLKVRRYVAEKIS